MAAEITEGASHATGHGCLDNHRALSFYSRPPVGAQSVIENPAKPKAANAGRVVVPEEVLAISDEGTTDYYFKWPHTLKTGPDGSLVLIDRDQILRFDKNGKFQGNFLKKGQGPGEMTYPGACLATVKNTIIISNYPNKIVFLDLAGKFEKEIPVRQEGRTNLSLLLLSWRRLHLPCLGLPPNDR